MKRYLYSEEPLKKNIPDPSPMASKRRFSPCTVPKGHIATQATPRDKILGLENALNISGEQTDEKLKALKLSSNKLRPVEISEEDENSIIYK